MTLKLVTAHWGDWPFDSVKSLGHQVQKYTEQALYVMRPERYYPKPQHQFWKKMELFAPWNHYLRPCLFMDLDVIIMDRIDDILKDPAEILHLSRIGSSDVMIIPENTEKIWEIAAPSSETDDGKFLKAFPHKFIQDVYPGVRPYKLPGHVKKYLKDPAGVRILVFHGKPRPWDCQESWIKEALSIDT